MRRLYSVVGVYKSIVSPKKSEKSGKITHFYPHFKLKFDTLSHFKPYFKHICDTLSHFSLLYILYILPIYGPIEQV
jgi:hypothetical protein